MRTLELLKSLSQKELKQIEGLVVGGKRKTMLPLFKALKKCLPDKHETDRPELFRIAFGKKYTKDQDYLLRNELRLLNEIIYEFLAVDCVKAHMKGNRSFFNRWLAQSYFDRKMRWFAGDIGDFLTVAKEDMQVEEVTLMCAIRAAWAGLFWGADKEKAAKELNEWEEEEKRRFLHRLRKIEYSRYFFLENHENGNPRILPENCDLSVPGATIIDFSDLDKTDWFVRYLTLQKYYMQSSGTHQLKYLKEITAIIDSDKAKNAISPRARVITKEALVWCLFMNGMYKEAEPYLDEAIELGKKVNIEISSSHALLRATTFFRLGKFDKAISAYLEYKEMLHAADVAGKAVMVVAYSNLYLGNPDDAIKILSERPVIADISLISRYIYVIAFILRKHYDLALGELKNLKRAITKPGSAASQDDILILDYFQAYVRGLSKSKSTRYKSFIKLEAEAQKTDKALRRTAFDNMELDWLIKQLKVEIAGE